MEEENNHTPSTSFCKHLSCLNALRQQSDSVLCTLPRVLAVLPVIVTNMMSCTVSVILRSLCQLKMAEESIRLVVAFSFKWHITLE